MAFTKFASVDVLEVKSAPSRLRSASLDHFADYQDYRTDDDFVYVRVRAISSRVNKNNDGWPAAELKKSYKTFIGKPLFVDHHNSDPKTARGVVVDAQLHIDEDVAKVSKHDTYYASAPKPHLPPTWVELLLEVDAKSYPKLARAIVDGDIDGVSMGANVEWTKCSHCGNIAHTPEEYCTHVHNKGAHFDFTGEDGQKTSKRAYEDCYDFGFFELSFVFDPADETALISDIKTAQQQKVAREVVAEGAQGFENQMISRARVAYRQALSEGKTEGRAWSAAMQALAGHGIKGKEALAMVQQATSAPFAQQVAKTAFEGLAQGGGAVSQPDRPVEDFTEVDSPAGMGENAEVRAWLIENFTRLGYDPATAAQAVDAGVDWHEVERVLRMGAQPEQALRIGQFTKEAPGGEHMEGVGKKRNRQYEHVLDSCHESHPDYDEDRCKELAARTVNKTRSEKGETKSKVAKTADRHNPRPQSEAVVAPEDVDTLRQEQICPICGSDMEDGVCVVCNYEEPPEGFDMPDLQQAEQVDEQMRQQETQQPGAPANVIPQAQPGGGAGSQMGVPTQMAASTTKSGTPEPVRDDMSNQVTAAGQEDGRVNTQERPVLPATQQTSDRPAEQRTEADEREAVESSTKDTTMSEQKVADGASAAGGEDTQPDARVDVDTKGGLATGDPLEDASHVDVEKETQEHAPHTDTWSGMEGQTEAVQGPAFPAGEVKASEQKTADQIGPDPRTPDFKVDVAAELGEGEVGERTKTWTETDGFADPVTGEVDPNIDPTGEGHEHQPSGVPSTTAADRAAGRRHALKSMKLADLEASLGLLDTADKFDRAAELEEKSEDELDASIETLSKVKTAGLRKAEPEKKIAGRMPSFKNVAAFDPSDHAVGDEELADSQIFLR